MGFLLVLKANPVKIPVFRNGVLLVSRAGKIRKIVKKLTSKYSTTNPRVLADCLGIFVVGTSFEGRISGALITDKGKRLIGINSNLPYPIQQAVLAHELGHAVLHPEYDYHFLTDYTHFCAGKLEAEANIFAKELLIGSEFKIDEHCDPGGSHYLFCIAEIKAKHEC